MSNTNDNGSSGDNMSRLGDEDWDLERQHRAMFNSPSEKEWSSIRSLAQPSFLKQVDSYGSNHTLKLNSSRTVTEK